MDNKKYKKNLKHIDYLEYSWLFDEISLIH